jgi:uncharacterized DUF497 family protein
VPDIETLLSQIEGFAWDEHNTGKNVLGHNVSQAEAEEIFFHTPVLLFDDVKHSASERRLLLYGSTTADRPLTAAFTIRANRIRVISVRDMSRKERRAYEEAR